MAKNIEPKLKKIGDYLKLEEDTVFTIPEYQRAYSWSIENCDKLWQDINDFVESESKDRYFFGTIIINCQDNQLWPNRRTAKNNYFLVAVKSFAGKNQQSNFKNT